MGKKSEKLYADSPSIKKDEKGKTGIKKPSEGIAGPTKADGEDMGVDGNPQEGAGDGLPIKVEEMHDRHQKEMKDTHKRHQEEIKDMHGRHQKETEKVTKEHGKTGGSEEAKIEGTK